MTRSLPDDPSLEYLKKEAKHIHRAYKSKQESVCDMLRNHARFKDLTSEEILASSISLQEVQHALAIDYGYDGWSALRRYVEQSSPATVVETRVNFLPATAVGRVDEGLLGIDIGTSCIRLVELVCQDGKPVVLGCGFEPLIESAVRETSIEDEAAVVAALKRLVARCKPRTTNAAIAAPDSAVLCKLIEMPKGLDDDELEREICLGADQYVPYPLREVSLAYEVRGASSRNPENIEVMLTACRRQNTDVRRRVLEKAGLTPCVIDVEAHCINRVFHMLSPELPEPVALFEIGSTLSRLTVLTKTGSVPYSRQQLFGVAQLTTEIQRRYRVTFEQADAAVRHGDIGYLEDYDSAVFQPFLAACVQQAVRNLGLYLTGSLYDSVGCIVLTGGGALLPGLVPLMAAKTKLEVKLADPFAPMEIAPTVDSDLLHKDAATYATACGLALRCVTDYESGRHSRTVVVPDDLEQEQQRRSHLAITRFLHKMLNEAVTDEAAEIHFVRDHTGIEVSFADSRESHVRSRPPVDLWPGIVEELCLLFSIDSPAPATMRYESDSGAKVRFRMIVADADESLVLQVITLSEP
jgi:type IV pilus assembly protein PilM